MTASPRGPRDKGLHFCASCGKRGRTADAVGQHIRDAHGGEGEIVKEPSRQQIVKTSVQRAHEIDTLKSLLKEAMTTMIVEGILGNDRMFWPEAFDAIGATSIEGES